MPPIKKFIYPGGERICRAGKVRAAFEGSQILNNELEANEIYERARKGEWAQTRCADTNKHNLISMVVARLAKTCNLTDYVDQSGNFIIDCGKITNINDPCNRVYLKQITNLKNQK